MKIKQLRIPNYMLCICTHKHLHKNAIFSIHIEILYVFAMLVTLQVFVLPEKHSGR